jgi:glycosyltransferase involved in cell wall biosynthesis
MKVSVLIPTYNRPAALAATLISVAEQSYRNFEVVISDQSRDFVGNHPVIRTICRILGLHGSPVRILLNKPPRGMAQQRQFLLDASTGKYSLFLDDDVILEPDTIMRLLKSLEEEGCGFAGMGLIGLSHQQDIRIDEQWVEWWKEPVQPETVLPGTRQWERHKLHNAANLLHAGRLLRPGEQRKYKIAWVGGCVLYDTVKLRDTGGFGFWRDLPAAHCGEDVLAQLRLMKKYGGFGLMPSGAFHQELPTTISCRDINAPEYLK